MDKRYQSYMITEWPIEYETYIHSTNSNHKLNLSFEFSKDIIAGNDYLVFEMK